MAGRAQIGIPRALVAGLALGFLLALVSLSTPGRWLEQRIGLPLLYALRGPVPPPPGALVIGLDEASLRWLNVAAADLPRRAPELAVCLGRTATTALSSARTPGDLPRRFHACLIERLTALGAGPIVYDIVFNMPRPGDTQLAEAIARSGRVLLLDFVSWRDEMGLRLPMHRASRPALIEAALGRGAFVVQTEAGDAVSGYRTRISDLPALGDLPGAAAMAAGRTLPSNRPALQPLWLYGPPGTVPTLALRSAVDPALHTLPDDLTGHAVFVGRVDPRIMGVDDHFTAPFPDAEDRRMPGAELAATAFLNIVARHLPILPRPWAGAGLVAALGLALGALAMLRVGPHGWLAILALAAAYAGLAHIAFARAEAILPTGVGLALGVPLALALWLAQRLLRARRVIAEIAPPEVMDALLSGEEAAPETDEATIAFIDIIDSTGFAARLSGEAFADALTAHYDRADAAIRTEGGMIVEFTGDGVLAIFPTRLAGPNHAARALTAIRRLALAPALPAAPELRFRAGLDTGLVSIGRIGAAARYSYKAMGLPVILASRIEAAAKAEDDGAHSIVLMSDAVFRASGIGPGQAVPLGARQLRGLAGPVILYRLHLRPAFAE